ncbi:MAG: hypothetical protein IPH63_05410 [Flavobacteriales bacterium]|nr:hypothetical protein [Flavobacteriales bacterium]
MDALQSPITLSLSGIQPKRAQQAVGGRTGERDRKRALLQELLHKYVQYDIIKLSPDAFDDFIEFCSVPDEVIKGLSQYDFLVYMKRKYELYSSLGPTRRH